MFLELRRSTFIGAAFTAGAMFLELRRSSFIGAAFTAGATSPELRIGVVGPPFCVVEAIGRLLARVPTLPGTVVWSVNADVELRRGVMAATPPASSAS